MLLVIDVPEWAQERDITVFAGIELLAAKPFTATTLRIKKDRCNWCGKCCILPDGKKCDHSKLIGDHEECDLATERPFSCCNADPCASTPNFEDCSCCITYAEVDIL